MRIIASLLLALFMLTAAAGDASARRHPPSWGAPGPWQASEWFMGANPASAPETRQRVRQRADGGRYAAHGGQVVGHPPGCPGRAFCGCGASVRVFGHSVRSLWPSRAWFRFPRAAPAHGMAAVRPGHVFVLDHHIAGNTWMVYDANSGGHRTRIHPRSIAGYAIVNPRA